MKPPFVNNSLLHTPPVISPVPLQPQLAAFVPPLVERPTGHFPDPLSSPSLGIFRSYAEPSYRCHDPQGVMTNGAPVAESFPHLPPFLGLFGACCRNPVTIGLINVHSR